MKTKSFLLAFAIAASCFLPVDGNASSLFGRVIEVNSGDVLTIFNLNRPVRVRLLGVDAPELGQPFADAARKHLADLVYDKSVLVEYSGIAPDGSLRGRVLLNDADIGAQMIRDGAAWFDLNNFNRLSATDCAVYQLSEQAARSERRGLWEAESPVAPWDFVKAETLRKYPIRHLNSFGAAQRGDRPVPELTNLTLMMAGLDAGVSRRMTGSDIDAAWASLTSATKSWREMKPVGQNFSAFVPEEGRQVTYPVRFGDQPIDVNMYINREGSAVYAVLWLTGPTYGEADKLAIDSIVLSGFVKGAHASYERADRSPFLCRGRREKDISMNGYTGKEFDLSLCSLPTRGRAFTRVVDEKREMYVAVVFYGEEEENVLRFIKSFRVKLALHD